SLPTKSFNPDPRKAGSWTGPKEQVSEIVMEF
ncbi:unnamed protein product, partial [marine sediment metagenome]